MVEMCGGKRMIELCELAHLRRGLLKGARGHLWISSDSTDIVIRLEDGLATLMALYDDLSETRLAKKPELLYFHELPGVKSNGFPFGP